MTFFEIKKIFWVLRALWYKPFMGCIGGRSYLGKPVSILGKKRIFFEDNVHIYPGARIEVYGNGKLIIGSGVSISQNVHIVVTKDTLKIGKNTLIGPNVYIANSDHGFNDVSKRIVDRDLTYRKTEIGENCFIGFGSAILPGTILKGNDIVGANSVLNTGYDKNLLIVGQPGKIKKAYKTELKRWEKIK